MKVVYFDGHCNVCNSFVDFLITRDKKGVLRFASLQGGTAALRLPGNAFKNVHTMVFEDNGKITERSTAAINAIAALDGVYSAVKLFLFVPRFARDGFYDWFAKHRLLWFGRREHCRIPSPDERARFLDD